MESEAGKPGEAGSNKSPGKEVSQKQKKTDRGSATVDPKDEPCKVAPLTPEEIQILRKMMQGRREQSQKPVKESGLTRNVDDRKRDE